jgi:hypothetical protein
MSDPQMTVDEILNVLASYPEDYPQEALNAAVTQRETIIPRLIDVLHQAVQDPDAYADSGLPFYAVFLLGHFRAAEAHQTILDLAALPCDKLEDLLGDALTEHLPMILYRTCGGQAEGLRSLALSPDACEYSVIAALHALSYAVVDGLLPRSEMMDFLKSLLDPDHAADLQMMTPTFAAAAAGSLHPAELMEAIEAAFKADLIDEDYTDLDAIREDNQQSQEAAYQGLRREMESYSLDDLHDTLSEWAMYGRQSIPPLPLEALPQQPAYHERPPKTYDSAKRKKKRKMAKASRKKNRGN